VRYTQSTELAIDSLFYMAAHRDREDFSIEEVATAQRVSASYLAKIFQQLAKAGILRSYRGARGGYSLGRSPAEITLLDISLVCEGNSPLYDCNAGAKNCTLGPKCLIVSTFNEAERRMREVLSGVSLADLLAGYQQHRQEAEWVGVK
jgi:Rrf2 family protein